MTSLIGPSAPHLATFTACLLLLLYGYEIFNFSLSIDEEVFTHHGTLWASIGQGRWGIGILSRLFPPMGYLPMMSTLLFCAALGVSAYILARVLFRSQPAQWAFAGFFVSSPFWPHIAEFNMLSWGVGVGCVIVVVCLLLTLAEYRLGHILAVGLLAFAIGIYQNLFIWFPLLLCLRYLSSALGLAPVEPNNQHKRFPWLRGGVIAIGGMLAYSATESLLLKIFSIELSYVQSFIRLSEFKTSPVLALLHTWHRSWDFIGGDDPIYLGYGRALTFLPLLGIVVVVGRLLWRGSLTRSQRLIGAASFAAALALAVSPVVVAAGGIPARVFITWVPLSAFLAGITLAYKSVFEKPLLGLLAVALFISIWVSVSLFNSDHLARKRDEILTARIMARVDQIVPDSPTRRIPFVVVAPAPVSQIEQFHKVEVFGTSFFDRGNSEPVRIAAYLRLLGIDTLEPITMAALAEQRAIVEGMPVWPAPGSVAMVNGILVVKLSPLPKS